MPNLASDVFVRVRAVLNDVAIDLYTDEVLQPYLRIANDDLSDELVDNGATVQKEVSTDIVLPVGLKTLTLPDNVIVPIELFEKTQGQDDTYYKKIHQGTFLPNDLPTSELRYWSWREQNVNFLGATVTKLVRMRYYRLITDLIGVNSPVELTHALNYLAYHTGALAAEHIGQNRMKAIDLESVANEKLKKLLKKEVKQTHGRPVRRKPFGLSKYFISSIR
jgi:hypothetical protein